MIIISNSVLENLDKAKCRQQYKIAQSLCKQKLNLKKLDLQKFIHLIELRSIIKQTG